MAPEMTHLDGDLLLQLRTRIRATVGKYVPTGSPVALLDFPNHSNVGDCAIWLGEVAYLRDAGCDIVYRCDIPSYNPAVLRRSLTPEGTILLHGGGNFGDIWPQHQRFREQVLSDFPDYRIVILPQTIHFQEMSSLETVRAALAAHPSVTVLARDEASFSFARANFQCLVDLSPDTALWLDPPGRASAVEDEILWLARTDVEAVVDPSEEDWRIPRVDWLAVARHDMKIRDWMLLRTLKRLTGLSQRTAGRYHLLSRVQGRLFDPVAAAHYTRGCQLLSRGSVVITDRLHAHLLCLLMGIPHVLLDNSYGKLSNFWKTWTNESRLAVWGPDPRAAVALAYGLVGS